MAGAKDGMLAYVPVAEILPAAKLVERPGRPTLSS